MNEVLITGLVKNVLPAFVNDTLGNISFGPELKSQSDKMVTFNGKEMTVDMMFQKSKENSESKMAIEEMVGAIRKANPYGLVNINNAGRFSRIWNYLTGRNDTKAIEFEHYCLVAESIAGRSVSYMDEAKETVACFIFLKEVFMNDAELLQQYLKAAELYISETEKDSTDTEPGREYGITRLRRKIINMKVMLSTLEMHCTQLDLSIEASVLHCDRLNDCFDTLFNMWRQQVKMFRSGSYDIELYSGIQNKFAALVTKLNKNTTTGIK